MKKPIFYKQSVFKDLETIDRSQRVRILDAIDNDLAENPEAGKRLSGEFVGLQRIRIGDYRVIYALKGEGVLILRIGHRKNVYR